MFQNEVKELPKHLFNREENISQQRKDKLLALMDELEGQKVQPNQPDEGTPQTTETVADDFALDEVQMKRIELTESIARDVLKLFDVDYDSLIRMDGKSPYALATAQSPALLESIKRADNPALEALKISLAFKPYADFTSKYGQTPEEIKASLRAEFEEESKGQKAKNSKIQHKAAVSNVAPFSASQAKGALKAEKLAKDLSDIFN